LEFLARFVGILILLKVGKITKLTDTLCADLHVIMIYCQYWSLKLRQTVFPVRYELRLQKVDHEACLIVNIKYGYLRAINGISPHLKDLKYCMSIDKILRNSL